MESPKLTKSFLKSQGWILTQQTPRYENFSYGEGNIKCSLNKKGQGFSISKLHWMNKDPESYLTTHNPNITEEDYFTILKLLNIEIP